MSGIMHAEYCTIAGDDGVAYRGPDQDWFPGAWQRRAGCGPTTAALISAYLAGWKAELRALHPDGQMQQTPFTAHMCRLWEYVTPAAYGLNRPEMMAVGLAAYASACGVTLEPKVLEIPAARSKRPAFEGVLEFLAYSLEQDCPVAFLNLCNGKVKELDRWHWVTIVAQEGTHSTILDNGQELTLDLCAWYETTRKRGGFVSALGDGAE